MPPPTSSYHVADSRLGCPGGARPAPPGRTHWRFHERRLDSIGKFGAHVMPHQLQFEDWVPFPVPYVFAFFSNPENLPRIMPATTHTRIEELHRVPPPALKRFWSLLHMRPAQARSSSLPFACFLSCQRERSGSPASPNSNGTIILPTSCRKALLSDGIIVTSFCPKPATAWSGTLVRDVVEYEVGFGLLGALANCCSSNAKCVERSHSGRKFFLNFFRSASSRRDAGPTNTRRACCESVRTPRRSSRPHHHRRSKSADRTQLPWARDMQQPCGE